MTSKSSKKIILILSLVYFVIVSIFILWNRGGFSPDQFFIAGLVLTLVIGKFKQFVHDWSVPVVLFLGYEYLRGLTPKLPANPHVYPMINFDKTVFGFIPTIKLQNLLFADNKIHWYDWLSALLYASHFIIPMIVGFTFWLIDKKIFKEYIFSILLLSYMAFLTFVIFPAMPPWMASNANYIDNTEKIIDKVFLNFSYPIDLPTVYRFFGANLVAAVPSLHAAYPWLVFLFLIRKFKKIGFFAAPYVFGVWFAIVYLGEHYVFDIVAGILYASFSFIAVTKWEKLETAILNLSQAKPLKGVSKN